MSLSKEEIEYNKPNERFKEHASIRIYEDDKMYKEIDKLNRKIDTIIKMLSAHDYACEQRNRNK
jgi:hypothetical protein